MFPNIVIHGLNGVGKSTVGAYLREKHGYLDVAIADILKMYLEEVNPLVLRERDMRAVPLNTLLAEHGGNWDKTKRSNPEVRRALQQFGQGARNAFGEDFWVAQFLSAYETFTSTLFRTAPAVVTDIRYENELTHTTLYFAASGVLSIKLVRPGHTSDGHPSEDGLPDEIFDAVIENNGSLEDLYSSVDITLGVHTVGAVTEEVAA